MSIIDEQLAQWQSMEPEHQDCGDRGMSEQRRCKRCGWDDCVCGGNDTVSKCASLNCQQARAALLARATAAEEEAAGLRQKNTALLEGHIARDKAMAEVGEHMESLEAELSTLREAANRLDMIRRGCELAQLAGAENVSIQSVLECIEPPTQEPQSEG